MRSVFRLSQRSLFKCRGLTEDGRDEAWAPTSSRGHQEIYLTDVDSSGAHRPRCARASLRPNMLYRFHVIQSREIRLLLPGDTFTSPPRLLKLANDNELASVLAYEVGHVVARHSLKTLKQSQDYNDIASHSANFTGSRRRPGARFGGNPRTNGGRGFVDVSHS